MSSTVKRVAVEFLNRSARGNEEDGDDFGWCEGPCTNCAPNKLGQCGKLLKVNAGEVAERLKAAVC